MPEAHALHPAAERELFSILTRSRREFGPATAGALADAIGRTVARACVAPSACTLRGEVRGETVRSRRVRGFPFRVVFVVRRRVLVVIALEHDKRRSAYWSRRI